MIGGSTGLNGFIKGEKEMQPTRNEILLALLTLIKVRETYDNLDPCDTMEVLDVIRLLDRLQGELANVER
jgi:hypothetical protein